MPYSNLDKSKWNRMDKCVRDVQNQGHDKKSSIAICYSSMMKGKELAETLKSFELKAAPNYRVTDKGTAEDNNLPDSAFLYVESGGKKDSEGKTEPRSLRHLPYRTSSGAIDAPRLRNALSRLGQSNTGDTSGDRWLTASVRDSLRAKAEKLLANVNNKSEKSIMDAPNLRGDDVQRCLNCKYAQAIVTDDMAMPMATDTMTMMETQKDMSAELICTQFDFMTEPDFVCDGYEAIPPDVMTMKQADGKYRWVLFSSSSYQDHDGEIVSQKALQDDTDRMNATKDYGTLDWWHTPIILGDCDFSMMQGRISIESGTFRDDWIGEQFATMKGLGASRTFFNPINEPDAEGVYHHIKTFSRAILPAERASNRLTLVDVSAKENQKMSVVDKAKELAKKLGGTPEAEKKVDELLQAAETLDTAAKEAGLTSKETAQEETPSEEKKTVFIGDMTPEEFDAKLTATVEKFLTPAVKEISAQVAKMNEAQQVTAKESSDKLAATIKSQQDIITDVSARLAALEGLKPRAYRATEDPNNVTTKETVAEKTPKGDKQMDDSLSKWLGS